MYIYIYFFYMFYNVYILYLQLFSYDKFTLCNWVMWNLWVFYKFHFALWKSFLKQQFLRLCFVFCQGSFSLLEALCFGSQVDKPWWDLVLICCMRADEGIHAPLKMLHNFFPYGTFADYTRVVFCLLNAPFFHCIHSFNSFNVFFLVKVLLHLRLINGFQHPLFSERKKKRHA